MQNIMYTHIKKGKGKRNIGLLILCLTPNKPSMVLIVYNNLMT